MSLLPKSKLGTWGFYLTVAFAVLFLLATTVNVMFIPAFAIFALGIAGVILNIIAFIKKDFSWLGVIIGVLLGAFVIFWVGGELLFPH
jgi:hypothetical protein